MDADQAFANGAFIPGSERFPALWKDRAAAFRVAQADRAELRIPYGPAPRQVFDLFRPAGAARGLLIFVHGGYWRLFGAEYWSHLAAGGLAQGLAVAMPSYTLAPAARISAITVEIAHAVASAADRVAGPVLLAGHSAGGHLVARMICADVALPDAVAARIAGVVPISPVADLRPLLATAMNADLRLDAAEARAESPVLHRPGRPVPVTVWVGAEERPVFLDQARALSRAWGAGLRVAPGRHHMDIVDGLADPWDPLCRSLAAAADQSAP